MPTPPSGPQEQDEVQASPTWGDRLCLCLLAWSALAWEPGRVVPPAEEGWGKWGEELTVETDKK